MADIHAGSLSNVSLTKSVYVPQCVDIGKDFLTGYRQDYYFFQYDADTYALLYDFDGEYSMSQSGFTLSGSCSVLEIDRLLGGVTNQSGHITGSIGSDSFSNCDISLSTNEYQYVTSVIPYSGTISINSNSRLAYGSDVSLPHLVGGGERYVYSEILLLAIFFISVSLDLVFRRISR